MSDKESDDSSSDSDDRPTIKQLKGQRAALADDSVSITFDDSGNGKESDSSDSNDDSDS